MIGPKTVQPYVAEATALHIGEKEASAMTTVSEEKSRLQRVVRALGSGAWVTCCSSLSLPGVWPF